MLEPLQFAGVLWLGWGAYWLISSRNVARTESSESHAARSLHVVPLAIAFWALFSSRMLWPGGFLRGPIQWAGVLLAGLGLGFACWARRHLGRYWSGIITLKEGHRLIRTGPYALARHPIYTGILVGFLGTACAGARSQGFAAFALAWLTFDLKRRREEALLVGRFGDEYRRYQEEVGALWPRWSARKG